MKKFFLLLLTNSFIFHIGIKANDSFSVEIEALTLVMEKLDKDFKDVKDPASKKPSYMAFKQDECNAKVEVTEKNGFQITNKESFDVNVCKKEIFKIKTN